MTRKHFEAIACTVRNSAVDDAARATIARELAVTLSRFNSGFDRERFIAACVSK